MEVNGIPIPVMLIVQAGVLMVPVCILVRWCCKASQSAWRMLDDYGNVTALLTLVTMIGASLFSLAKSGNLTITVTAESSAVFVITSICCIRWLTVKVFRDLTTAAKAKDIARAKQPAKAASENLNA